MKNLVLVLVMAIAFVGCSVEELRLEQPVNCKQEALQMFGQLVNEEAVANGWDSSGGTFVNTTDIFAPGFLDVTYDPNMAIFHAAIYKYMAQYNLAIADCNQPI